MLIRAPLARWGALNDQDRAHQAFATLTVGDRAVRLWLADDMLLPSGTSDCDDCIGMQAQMPPT